MAKRANKEDKAYLQAVQGIYKAYCMHVHNAAYMNNSASDESELKWYPSKFHKDLCDRVQEFIEKPTDKAYEIMIINTPPQHGKQCSDDTPVLTRGGWKNHGDLVVGDEVLNHKGKWVKVLHVFDKYEEDCEVTFTNGEKIHCHENHEWLVYDRSLHGLTIRETKYMEAHIEDGFVLPDTDLPEEIEKKHLKGFSKQRKIAICDIKRTDTKTGNCITVEGGIYLVGRAMLPTHNSTTLTETLPSWYLMKNPDNCVIQVSYGDDLAERFGKRNLEKVKEFGNIFGVEVDPKKATNKDFWIRGHKGRMISKGIGSGLTGNTGHLIIIDDPIKNREQADSERTRNTIWNEFIDSIVSRTQAGSKIILIMTRWHVDDLAGRILENMPDITTYINYECECESPEDDPLGRELGEPLCPEMGKGKEWLEEFKAVFTSEAGMRSWYALYQGKPTLQEGNILQKSWWQYYDPAKTPVFDQMVMSVDASFKDGDKNDFVAISVWGKRENIIYLVKMVNEHLNFNGTIHKIRLLKAHYPRIGAIYIEDAANGSAIIQTLSHEIMGIIPVAPDKSKEARVNAVSFVIEAGNVYLPEGDPMTYKFVEQCAKFPNDKHDDMVDSATMALLKLSYSRRGRAIRALTEKVDGWTLPKDRPRKRVDVGGTIRTI